MKRLLIVLVLLAIAGLGLSAPASRPSETRFDEVFLAEHLDDIDGNRSDKTVRIFIERTETPSRNHKLLIVSNGPVVNNVALELKRGQRVVLPLQQLPPPGTSHAVLTEISLTEAFPTKNEPTDGLYPEPIAISRLTYRAK